MGEKNRELRRKGLYMLKRTAAEKQRNLILDRQRSAGGRHDVAVMRNGKIDM